MTDSTLLTPDSCKMKHPVWKRALSYIIDLPLEKWSSPENGTMELALSRGEVRLSTNNAVYSFGRHYRSFDYAFDTLEIHNRTDIQHVLVLGWGIGSIADLLNGHPTITHITGVEHDATLVDFFDRQKTGFSFETAIKCEDAFQFLLGCDQQFDLICSDIFVDNKTPAGIIATNYLETLTALLKPGGSVLLSKLNLNIQDRQQNKQLEANLKEAGLDAAVLDTIGNRIYVWQKQ